jgi:chromosome partitioning protein
MCEHRGAQPAKVTPFDGVIERALAAFEQKNSSKCDNNIKRSARLSMRHVMVMNSKGGCGKSTLATNLASHFAIEGYRVAIADYDPQRTSLDWLAMRPGDLPRVTGIAAYDEGLRAVPRDTEVLVIDAPARTHGSEMNELVRRAETILVPVLPSPIDMKA